MKAYYDKRAADPDFVEGQKVWVFTPKTYKGLSKKLLHNYHGPYRVVEKLSPVHYKLRTCSNKPVSSIVHANRPIEPPTAPVEDTPFLTVDDFPPDSFASSREERHTTRDAEPDSPTAGEQRGLLPHDPNTKSAELIDHQTVFNAEQLLEARTFEGTTQYLVKWAGFPLSEATWEPGQNILDPRLPEEFQARTGADASQ